MNNKASSTASVPLLIEFAPGSQIVQVSSSFPEDLTSRGEYGRESTGTFVELLDGRRVCVPTDQVILSDDRAGSAKIGLGGMTFEGTEGEHLIFFRVRDLLPDELLNPFRRDKITLAPDCVASIKVQGAQVWPKS